MSKSKCPPACSMLMRRLVAWEPASVHDGLVHIYNCFNQGVVLGHTQKDVKWLVDHDYVKLYDNDFGFQDIIVTKRGGWVFRRRIFGFDGWWRWSPRIDFSHRWLVDFSIFRFRITGFMRKLGR